MSRRSEIEEWMVAYHGTGIRKIPSILTERRLMFPGDILQDGTKIEVERGDVGAHGPTIYVSPATHDKFQPHVLCRPALGWVPGGFLQIPIL